MTDPLPRGACDCHAHVFGPAARFPYAEPRSYTPHDAPLGAYLAHLDRLGCERGVLVQPSAYGRDNRAMLDALAQTPQRLRGVAVGGGAGQLGPQAPGSLDVPPRVGEKIKPVRGVPPPRVVNLMDALRASVDAEKKAPAPSRQARRPAKKKAGQK